MRGLTDVRFKLVAFVPTISGRRDRRAGSRQVDLGAARGRSARARRDGRHRHLRPAQHPAARLRGAARQEPRGEARLRLDLRARDAGRAVHRASRAATCASSGSPASATTAGSRSSTALRSAAGATSSRGARCARSTSATPGSSAARSGVIGAFVVLIEFVRIDGRPDKHAGGRETRRSSRSGLAQDVRLAVRIAAAALCEHGHMTTIVVVDDHPTFRATACALLEAEGFVVVGEAEDGLSALDVIARLAPGRRAARRPAARHRRVRGGGARSPPTTPRRSSCSPRVATHVTSARSLPSPARAASSRRPSSRARRWRH